MEPQNLSLSIFFPCHNEQDNIERVTQQALEVARGITPDFEILLINDGSTDDTARVADALAAEHPEVRAIHHPVNRGYGAALQTGFTEAAKNWVFYTDGDGQFDISEITKLLPLKSSSTIVSAYRAQRSDSLLRKINGACWSMLVNLLLGIRVRDIDCAFKLFPSKLFLEIELHATGALIDAEILAKAVRRGYQIRQLPVSHYPRIAGTQSGASMKVILRAFKELFQLRNHIRRTSPPSRPTANA